MTPIDILNAFLLKSNSPDQHGASPEIRIVLEAKPELDELSLRGELNHLLNGPYKLEPLFSGDAGDLKTFFLLRIGGISLSDLGASPFDLPNEIASRLDLISAEPDSETGFFVQPAEDRRPDPEQDAAFWCWVDIEAPEDTRWATKAMRVDVAIAFSQAEGRPAGGKGILIAQPDTGVTSHVELEDGAVRRDLGHNFVENNDDPTDTLSNDFADNPGHGTGTSSVAISRLAGKVMGSAPEAELVPIRAIRSVLVLDGSRVARAIDFARQRRLHVITMSLGGSYSSSMHAAIREAVDENIIVLAAAGNCVGEVVWPARLDDCLAVAGCNIKLMPWQGSCRGDEVDITAPAELVWRALADLSGAGARDKVSGGQGTSFAVALTAGVAALWLAHHGRDNLIATLRPRERLQDRFRKLLSLTARRRDDGSWDAGMGPGLIDADRLLRAAILPPLNDAIVADAPPGSHSVMTLVEKVVGPIAGDAAPAGVGAPVDLRKHAAELSYLALSKAWRDRVARNAPRADAVPGAVAQTVEKPSASAELRDVVLASGDPRLVALIA